MFKTQLRNARKAAGKTQQECADYLGISYSTFSGYETGKREPDIEKLRKIAVFLGVSGDYLLEIGNEQRNVPVNSKRISSNDAVVSRLLSNSVEIVDKREQGGSLWAIGGKELSGVMSELKKQGFVFIFSLKGSKATNGQPAWYLKSMK